MAKDKKKDTAGAKKQEAPVEETTVKEEQAAPIESEPKEPAEETAPEETVIPEPDPCELLQKQLDTEKDKYLRLAAEFDNFRRRSQKEKEALRTDIRSAAILELLPVYDNLERALAAECSDAAFYKGVEMTMSQLKSIFTGMGVSEIPAVGEKFDPTVHNAVMHIDDDKYEQSIVVQEFQKGFKLGDKVIRPSVVQVAN